MRASTLILPLVASAGASAAALSNAEKVAALRAAPQQTDRVNILSEDQDVSTTLHQPNSSQLICGVQFVFDFLKANFTNPAGTAVGAAVGNFPALVNNGLWRFPCDTQLGLAHLLVFRHCDDCCLPRPVWYEHTAHSPSRDGDALPRQRQYHYGHDPREHRPLRLQPASGWTGPGFPQGLYPLPAERTM